MATQTIQFIAPTGLTITAKLFSYGSDTVVDSQSATEATNRKGVYTAAFTDVAAGTYQLIAFESSTPKAVWAVDLTLTTATFQSYEYNNDAPTKTEMDAAFTEIKGAGFTSTDNLESIKDAIPIGTGSGSVAYIYGPVNDSGGDPLDGVEVWVTASTSSTPRIAQGYTNATGYITFQLDPGAYYFWAQLSGYNFDTPDGPVTVS